MTLDSGLDALPHETVFSRVSDALGRSEVVKRSRYLRLRLVLSWLGRWDPLLELSVRLAKHAGFFLRLQYQRYLHPSRGYVRLLDEFYAAVRIHKLEDCAGSWIPSLPATLPEALVDAGDLAVKVRSDHGIRALMRDKCVLLKGLHCAIETLQGPDGHPRSTPVVAISMPVNRMSPALDNFFAARPSECETLQLTRQPKLLMRLQEVARREVKHCYYLSDSTGEQSDMPRTE